MGIYQDDGYEGRLIGERPLTKEELAAWQSQQIAIEESIRIAEQQRQAKLTEQAATKAVKLAEQEKRGITVYCLKEIKETYHQNLNGDRRFSSYSTQKEYYATITSGRVFKLVNKKWQAAKNLPTRAKPISVVVSQELNDTVWEKSWSSQQEHRKPKKNK